jgi:hypothetical protein
MNYGFDPTCAGYRPSRKRKLAARLEALVQRDEFLDAHGMRPYVEVDGLYRGVRIRRITHLSEPARDRLVAEADAIFLEVMAK